MTTPDAPRRYQLGGQEARSLLGRREPGETSVLIGAVVLGVVVSLTSGGAPAGFLVLAVLVVAAVLVVFLPVRGRTLFRWLPLDVRFAMSRRSGQDQYTSGHRLAGIDLATGQPVPVAPPPPVGRLLWLSGHQGEDEVAVLVQKDAGTVIAALEVEGPGLGMFDGVDHELGVARWGGLLRDLANSDGLVRRLQLLERSVPADPQAHSRYVQESGWIMAPAALRDSYEDLQRHVGAVSEQHRNYVVLSIPAGRDLARAAKGAGGGDAGMAAVAAREVDALRLRLEDAGTRVLGALDAVSLQALIASLYCPDLPIDAGDAARRGETWPRSTAAQRTWLDVEDGDWLHATAWVRQWPMVPVGVNFLAPLLVQVPGIVRSVSVVLDLVPTDVAMAEAMCDLTSDEAEAASSAKAGRTADPRHDRQLGQAGQRAADLAAGAAGVRLVGYVTVSSGSPEGLEQAKRVVRTAAARAWLSLEWCDKEHDTAFVNTLPLARGLR